MRRKGSGKNAVYSTLIERQTPCVCHTLEFCWKQSGKISDFIHWKKKKFVLNSLNSIIIFMFFLRVWKISPYYVTLWTDWKLKIIHFHFQLKCQECICSKNLAFCPRFHPKHAIHFQANLGMKMSKFWVVYCTQRIQKNLDSQNWGPDWIETDDS